MSAAIFERTDGPSSVRATELARGPWDPNAQHGGAAAAMLMRAFEQLANPDDLAMARVTYELLRPVPLAALTVAAEVVRPGRRVQLLEGSIRGEDGKPFVRATALRIRRADEDVAAAAVGARHPATVPPGPEQAQPNDFPGEEPMFARDAMEIRFVAGRFLEQGPATAWFRLRHPLIEGEDVSPLQRLAAAADFGNGISAALPWDGYLFINPDLTLYIDREPAGEWVCLEAETDVSAGGVGVSQSVIYDQHGRVGRAVQALLVTSR